MTTWHPHKELPYGRCKRGCTAMTAARSRCVLVCTRCNISLPAEVACIFLPHWRQDQVLLVWITKLAHWPLLLLQDREQCCYRTNTQRCPHLVFEQVACHPVLHAHANDAANHDNAKGCAKVKRNACRTEHGGTISSNQVSGRHSQPTLRVEIVSNRTVVTVT